MASPTRAAPPRMASAATSAWESRRVPEALSVVGPGWSGQLHRPYPAGRSSSSWPARLAPSAGLAGRRFVAPHGVELFWTEALEPADHL